MAAGRILVDPFDYGDHKFEVKDAASGTLIFSQTYCTLFREWQTTQEAENMTQGLQSCGPFSLAQEACRG